MGELSITANDHNAAGSPTRSQFCVASMLLHRSSCPARHDSQVRTQAVGALPVQGRRQNATIRAGARPAEPASDDRLER